MGPAAGFAFRSRKSIWQAAAPGGTAASGCCMGGRLEKSGATKEVWKGQDLVVVEVAPVDMGSPADTYRCLSDFMRVFSEQTIR
jgi:hypothetical protein